MPRRIRSWQLIGNGAFEIYNCIRYLQEGQSYQPYQEARICGYFDDTHDATHALTTSIRNLEGKGDFVVATTRSGKQYSLSLDDVRLPGRRAILSDIHVTVDQKITEYSRLFVGERGVLPPGTEIYGTIEEIATDTLKNDRQICDNHQHSVIWTPRFYEVLPDHAIVITDAYYDYYLLLPSHEN